MISSRPQKTAIQIADRGPGAATEPASIPLFARPAETRMNDPICETSLFSFGARDRQWNRFADLSPSGKVPAIWKARALGRLCRLDRAGIAIQEYAGAGFGIEQCEAVTL